MAEMNSNRIEWIDFAKGVVIILVVLGHVIEYNSDLSKIIYVFHMPFFFIMAGFLLNLDKWGGVDNYKAFTTKLIKRLLIPYYLAEFLWYPIFIFKEYYFGHLSRIIFYSSPIESFLGIFIGKATLLPIGPLWFLPCLLLTEIIFIKLYNNLAKSSAEIFGAAIIFTSHVGLFFNWCGYMAWGINVALVSQIFLFAGILIRRYNVVERLNLKFCLCLEIIFILTLLLNKRIEMSGAIYGEPLLFYAGGIAGTLLVMKISALINSGKIFSLISDCGRQSIIILVLHLPIIEVVYNILVRKNFVVSTNLYNDPAVIFVVTVTSVLIPLIIAKRFGKLPVIKYFCA